jgi:hypothetical protein
MCDLRTLTPARVRHEHSASTRPGRMIPRHEHLSAPSAILVLMASANAPLPARVSNVDVVDADGLGARAAEIALASARRRRAAPMPPSTVRCWASSASTPPSTSSPPRLFAPTGTRSSTLAAPRRRSPSTSLRSAASPRLSARTPTCAPSARRASRGASLARCHTRSSRDC